MFPRVFPWLFHIFQPFPASSAVSKLPAPSTAAMPGAEPGIRWENQLHLEFPMASCPVHTMISHISLGDDANGEL